MENAYETILNILIVAVPSFLLTVVIGRLLI